MYIATIFGICVFSVNARSLYKELYGIISPTLNGYLFYLAIMVSVSYSLIGVFDIDEFRSLHVASIVILFTGGSVYLLLVSHYLKQGMD